jgi:hypothetical protein
MMLRFDSDRMYCAVSDRSFAAGGPKETAYLNRHTGEIVFLTATADEAEAWGGVPGLEVAAKRAAVENRPSDWIEIPRMSELPVVHEQWCDKKCRRDLPRQGRLCTCGAVGAAAEDEQDADQFISDFLRENGINVE